MKKLLGIIIGLLLIVGLQAQTSGTTYTLPANVTWYSAFSNSHVGDWDATTLKDSIAGTAAAKTWIFAIQKPRLYYYQFFVEYDTVLTPARVLGNHVIVWLDASIDGVTYCAIDSVLFHPDFSSLPTQIQASPTLAALRSYNLKDVTTGVLWRYLRIRAIGLDANKCAIISKLAVKVGLKD